MYLERLYDGGFSEWRSMWNREVLPYLRSLRPVAGPGLRIDRTPDGSLIRLSSAGGGAPSRPAGADFYQSYFKLKLSRNDEGVHSVTIADGATGGESIAVVNGYTTFRVAPYTEVVTANRLFYLKFRPATFWNDGAVYTPATLTIESLGNGPDGMVLPEGGTDGAFYTQLGRVLWNNAGKVRVVQDFTGGVADIRWYASCTTA